ncbi:MAG: sialate O-acetylesterase, partial [Candidatus Hydrogenedentota bacterium]
MFCYRIVTLFAVLVAGMAANAWAELRLPSLFTEHMVLQRGQSIPVWGWADAGAKVRVKLGGKSSNTSAAPDGTWRADLPSMKAGGPHMLTISSGDKTVKIGDVLIGEVWTGSGQSNMQWTVGLSRDSQTEIASANYGTMRLFYVPRKTADTPQTDVDAKWEVCTSETVPEFSAVLYYFGRTLLRELDVPIGLIHSSWGGTPAESWASRERLGSTPETRPILEWWDRHLKELPQLQADYQAKITAWEEQAKAAKDRGEPEPRRPGGEPFGADHPWRASSLYNAMIHPLVPYGIQGAIWYQGESNAGR